MKRLLLALGLLLAFGLGTAQTVVIGQSGLPETLDTGLDANSNTVAYQVLENLVFVDLETNELVPGLATNWSANEDSTVWTFELREGVEFHDGIPFDAEAVVFNIRRWNDPEFEFGFRDQGKTFVPWTWSFGGFKGEEGALLSGVKAIDEHTVEITLNEPLSFLPAVMSSSYLGMHSPKAIREAGIKYGTPWGVVGTGPFEFEEWKEGAHVELTRNDEYWGEPAAAERLIFLGIEEPTARLAQLKAGTLDIALNLSSDDLESIMADPQLEPALAEVNLNVGYLAFHQENEPFDDPRVRKAVAYAVDQEAIVEAFYGGLGTVATQFVPPTLWGRAEGIEGYGYDPERAKELLAEAGYPEGFDTELWYMPVSRPYFPAPQPIAETIASFLADVGIRAELKSEDWGTYLSDYNTGKMPMYMLGWIAEFPDPDNFLYTLFSMAPSALGWEDPRVMELLTSARRSSSREERQQLYAELARLLNEEMVQLPFAHNRVVNAQRKVVEGFVPAAFGTDVFKTVTKSAE
jgi:peptide/nickel transport system substrate-binding protein